MGEQRNYLVRVPAKGYQTYWVNGATSKAEAIRAAKAVDHGEPVPEGIDVEAENGELEECLWSRATAETDIAHGN